MEQTIATNLNTDVNVDVTLLEDVSCGTFEVVWGQGAELEVETALKYIKSGEQAINNYVNETILPPLQNYVDQARESANNADADADNAAESAGLAAQSEANAKASEIKATQEATASAESAYNSQQSALAAYEYASNADEDAKNALETLGHILESETITTKASQEAVKAAEEAKEIIGILSTVYQFKGSVDSFSDLPTDAKIGDVYDVLDSGTNYAWTGERWDSLGANFDLSEYLKKTSSEEQFIQAPITIMDSMSVTDGAGGSFNVSLPNGVATIATNNGLDVLTETTFEDGVKVRGVGHSLAFEGMAGTTTSGILLKDTYGGNQSKIGHYATGDRYGLRFYTETALGYSGYFDLYTTISNITIADFSTAIESVLVPTPDETDNSKRAANTEWVHTLFHGGELDVENLVDRTSNQTVDGIKTFNKGIVGTLQNYYAYNTDSKATPWKKVMSLTVTGQYQTVLIPFVLTGYSAGDRGISLGNITVRVDETAGTLGTSTTKISFTHLPDWAFKNYDFRLLYKNNQGDGSSVLVEFWIQVKNTYNGVCLIILDEKQGGANKLNRSTRSWYNNPTGVASLPSDYNQIGYEFEQSYTKTPTASSNDTSIATTAWVNTKVANSLPVGTIIAYAGLVAPDGFLPCNGAAVSRTTYAALLNVIGTASGVGDGKTTFNLPNLNNGTFLEGGESPCNYKNAGLPNITGSINRYSNWTEMTATGAFSRTGATGQNYAGSSTGAQSTISFDASKSNAIYGKSTTVQPKSATVLFCIKY